MAQDDETIKKEEPTPEAGEAQKIEEGQKVVAKGKRQTAVGKLLGALVERKREEKVEKEAERERETVHLKRRVEDSMNAHFFNFSALEQLMDTEVDVWPYVEERVERESRALTPRSESFDRLDVWSLDRNEEISDLLKFIHEKMPNRDIGSVVDRLFAGLQDSFTHSERFGNSEKVKEQLNRINKRIFRFLSLNNIPADLNTDLARTAAAETVLKKDCGGYEKIRFFRDSTKRPEDKGEFIVQMADKIDREYGPKLSWVEKITDVALETPLTDTQMSKVARLCLNFETDDKFLQMKELFGQETWKAVAKTVFRWSDSNFDTKGIKIIAEAFGNLDNDLFQKVWAKLLKDFFEISTRSSFKFNFLLNTLAHRDGLSPNFWDEVSFALITNGASSFVVENLQKLTSEGQKQIKEQLTRWGYNDETYKAESPSSQIIERFRKSEVLTEFWAKEYTSGMPGDNAISFEVFKQAISDVMGSVDEKSPEEISELINNPIFKRNLLEKIDKMVRDDRESKWERGEGDFRSQGIGRIESLKKCLEDLAKKFGKEVARLTEKEFAEISRDRAAIKKWQIENFYPKFDEKIFSTVDTLVGREVEAVDAELRADLDRQLSTIEESKRTTLETLQKVTGVSLDLVGPVSAALDKQIQETILLFARAEEGIQREEARIKQAAREVLTEINSFIKDPANRDEVELSEDGGGFITLFSVKKLTEGGEGRKHYDSNNLANDIYLETGMFKSASELINEAKNTQGK